MKISLDGQLIDPDAEVEAHLARLWVLDPDAVLRRLIEECAGMAVGPLLLPYLRELEHRRQWMRRYAQHPPTCGVAKGDACDCGLRLP